ncbi:MAG: LptF/LptG family permease [Deltaproteobacteria bacterium]
MKILDKYIIKSFFAPYIISFLIAEFILIMQFMWKYIDDFAGRGLSMFDFMKLLLFYGATVIPMAVPITILISTVMVYGDLGEKYELSSMKSSGISLIRIFMPGLVVALFTFAFSLFVSNYLKPKSAYKFLETFTALKRKKPTLNIQEKMFTKDFDGFTIQVNKKHKDGRRIEDIKIYNITDRTNENYNVLVAKKGEIFTTEDGRYFIMRLYDGIQYVERKISSFKKSSENTFPLFRYSFDTLEKSFDLSQFYNDNSGSFFSKRRDVMNSVQLMAEIDTFRKKITAEHEFLKPGFITILDKNINTASVENKKMLRPKEITEFQRAEMKRTYSNIYDQYINKDLDKYKCFAETIDSSRRYELLEVSYENTSYQKNIINNTISNIERYKEYKDYWELGLHQQYSWALICVIFLFIGAPLGSIIRKGGYGVPVLVAIMFFMAFIMLSIMGDKFSRANVLNPIINAWLPVIVLLPISIYITVNALRDSRIIFLKSK